MLFVVWVWFPSSTLFHPLPPFPASGPHGFVECQVCLPCFSFPFPVGGSLDPSPFPLSFWGGCGDGWGPVFPSAFFAPFPASFSTGRVVCLPSLGPVSLTSFSPSFPVVPFSFLGSGWSVLVSRRSLGSRAGVWGSGFLLSTSWYVGAGLVSLEEVLSAKVVVFCEFCLVWPGQVVEVAGVGAGTWLAPRTVIDTLLVRLHHLP